MKVVVYGTLKRGYGNNVVLGGSKFIESVVIKGYKLYNSGFPVARPSEGDSISGELWEVDSEHTLRNLDRLEGEGRMYIRTTVAEDTQMYVGPENYWTFDRMTECPKNADGHYEWSR